MSRFYRVPYSGTITNAGGNADLLAITPADDKPIRLVGWILGQTSEVGDAQEENLELTLHHMTGTVTVTGGTAVTGVANRPTASSTDAAPGFTATCNSSTVATTTGTDTKMEELGWNERASPWERWIPEELRPRAQQTEYLILRMDSTPADDYTIAVTFFIEEEG